MYKNLSVTALGISGRQSELIELALTYSFKGLDLDIDDFLKRTENQGLEHSRRFLDSAGLKVGGFDLPIQWEGDEPSYRSSMEDLKKIAELTAAIGATACNVVVSAASDDLPYHENFEMHRARLAEIAELLAQHEIRLAVGFAAHAGARQEHQYEFIHQAEPLLMLLKSVGSKNVGLLLDSWHWHLGGGGVDQLRELGGEKIASVRLADAPTDVDPASLEESQRLLPGEGGAVDCSAMLAVLAELQYTGPITAHPDPSQFTGMTRDNIVQRASQSLDEQYRAAGLTKSGKVEADEEKEADAAVAE